MNRSRHFRRVAALIALIGMLFMQYAVASYSCPMSQAGQGIAAVAMSIDSADQGMPGCLGMDGVQPNLCNAYDQGGNQSLDKPDLPQVKPFLTAGLAVSLIPIDDASQSTVLPPAAVLLTRATAPPLSIRNCCFRI